MSPSFSRRDLFLALGLAALMLATRGHHLPLLRQLPDAALAVFFLAGLALPQTLTLPALILAAVGFDAAAVTLGGGSAAVCVTPAYLCLLPAYGGLWLAGRLYQGYAARHGHSAGGFAASLLLATLFGQLCSSGGYYLWSGHVAEPSLAGLAARLVKYFPPVLGGTLLWVGLALVMQRAPGWRRRAGL